MKIYQQKGNDTLLTINHKTLKKIALKDVILLKADVNYTIFYLQNGKDKLVSRSIKFFEAHLETLGFLRVHRSFMINPNFVENYNEELEILTMTNGHKASISRRRKGVIGRIEV